MKLRNLLMLAVAVMSFIACEKKEDIILFSLPNLIFPAAGGEQEIGISCKGAWSISDKGDTWIESITPSNGVGDATIKIKTTANESGARRVSEIGFNEQSLLIYQEIGGDVDIKKLYGVWETETGDFKFTFNSDKTCTAVMSIVPNPIEATYELKGNIITILPMKINIVIIDITDKLLVASVNNKTLVLNRK